MTAEQYKKAGELRGEIQRQEEEILKLGHHLNDTSTVFVEIEVSKYHVNATSRFLVINRNIFTEMIKTEIKSRKAIVETLKLEFKNL